MPTSLQVCSRSVLDTTIPGIKFDARGECQFCKMYHEMDRLFPLDHTMDKRLGNLVAKIQKEGKNKKYDCVVGVSGGTDSTFTLYKAVKLGLRPLAVHFDNGWNSRIAVKNIKNACNKLNVDLYTYVVDWEEFKDIQISFLKASVSDAEIPTDIGIISTLIKTAAREGINYILEGHSFRTEFIMPIGWTYMDGRYVASVHDQFGTKKRKTYPNFTLWDMIWHNLVRRVKIVQFPDYCLYDKENARKLLETELGWEYYGGHHHESTYTKFFQSYYLPRKFNIDKRKTELSAMILAGHITRDQALKELEIPYTCDQETVDYTISKLGLSKEEFEKIMKTPRKSFHDYPTYFPLIRSMRIPVKIATSLGILPPLVYYKFFGI